MNSKNLDISSLSPCLFKRGYFYETPGGYNRAREAFLGSSDMLSQICKLYIHPVFDIKILQLLAKNHRVILPHVEWLCLVVPEFDEERDAAGDLGAVETTSVWLDLLAFGGNAADKPPVCFGTLYCGSK